MNVKEFVTAAGRKFTWGYAGLAAIFMLCALSRLSGAEFVGAFGALVAAIMAANYGENREKARATKETSNAPAVPAAPPPAA